MSEPSLRAFTARFEPEIYEELRLIAKLQDSSMNRFVVEAVACHLRQTRQELVKRYEDTVERLKAYAKKDPDFEQAIEAFVDGEMRHEDPVEGNSMRSPSEDQRRLDEILTSG